MNDVSTTASNSNDRTMAILAHIGGLFTSWVAPLIIYLIKKNEADGAFSTDQAKEALNFQLTIFLAYMVSGLLMVVLIGILLIWIVGLVNLVLCIVAAVKASNGEYYRYPFAIRLIK